VERLWMTTGTPGRPGDCSRFVMADHDEDRTDSG